jgi:hypothetical protein
MISLERRNKTSPINSNLGVYTKFYFNFYIEHNNTENSSIKQLSIVILHYNKIPLKPVMHYIRLNNISVVYLSINSNMFWAETVYLTVNGNLIINNKQRFLNLFRKFVTEIPCLLPFNLITKISLTVLTVYR